MQTISILNKVELALRRQSSVRDRFEVSGVESRDRGGRRRDNLPQRLDIKSPEILGTRIKTLGMDDGTHAVVCEKWKIFSWGSRNLFWLWMWTGRGLMAPTLSNLPHYNIRGLRRSFAHRDSESISGHIDIDSLLPRHQYKGNRF